MSAKVALDSLDHLDADCAYCVAHWQPLRTVNYPALSVGLLLYIYQQNVQAKWFLVSSMATTEQSESELEQGKTITEVPQAEVQPTGTHRAASPESLSISTDSDSDGDDESAAIASVNGDVDLTETGNEHAAQEPDADNAEYREYLSDGSRESVDPVLAQWPSCKKYRRRILARLKHTTDTSKLNPILKEVRMQGLVALAGEMQSAQHLEFCRFEHLGLSSALLCQHNLIQYNEKFRDGEGEGV